TLIDKLLKRGVKHIVIKRGPRGASYFSAGESHHVAGFEVPVVDPTGAGDCFGATFVSLFLAGASPEDALQWANASGSLAISQRGPMEGTSTREHILAFLAARK
ncbi:carbohydrate kinase family protein, partial [Serratia marcescens]|uniref:carbohydrate kinase family protein n=1 Tax=Serratia marcescens TaxID=615 RepID=UPI0021CCD1D4